MLQKPGRLTLLHRNQVQLTDFQCGGTEYQFVSTGIECQPALMVSIHALWLKSLIDLGLCCKVHVERNRKTKHDIHWEYGVKEFINYPER